MQEAKQLESEINLRCKVLHAKLQKENPLLMDKRKATRRAISKCLAALCELDLMLLSDQMPHR